MSVTISIRNVPEHVRDQLALRAAQSAMSMQQYLRTHLEQLVSQPSPEMLMAEVRARKADSGARLGADAILQARDADRR